MRPAGITTTDASSLGSSSEGDSQPPGAVAIASPPPILYGTAWKKERTTELVVQAIENGFRGIDTACQPKHYREDLVGEALKILETRGVPRSSIWVQTKYTPLGGQDAANVPYDATAELETQVEQSIATSLRHLGKIDSLVLHSPLDTLERTKRAWTVFEAAVDSGQVRQLGVSNCYDFGVFRALFDAARHKPRVLQNRFYDKSGYDAALRAFCLENGIAYQTFWTLTANGDKIRRADGPIASAAKRLQATGPQVLFAWLIRAGHQPLTGTTSIEHMRQDLQTPHLATLLGDDEVVDIAAEFKPRGY